MVTGKKGERGRDHLSSLTVASELGACTSESLTPPAICVEEGEEGEEEGRGRREGGGGKEGEGRRRREGGGGGKEEEGRRGGGRGGATL